MNICEHLTVTARLFPHKEAIVFEGHRFTFAELNERSQAAARLLTDAGVMRGDRVAIMLPNVPAFVVWYYAALRAGAIAVSISTRLAAAEVAFLISDCDARVLIAVPETLSSVRNELPDCVSNCLGTSELGDQCDGKPLSADTDDPSAWVETQPAEAALILYTSGTTGFAKGATLSHMNVRSNVHAFNHLCNMQPNDRILLAVPLFHCFGQNALLNAAFNVGATLILQRRFDLAISKQLIAEENVTQLYGVPMMFQLLHDRCEPSDLSTIHYCFSAAATLPIQTSQRWLEKFGMPIHEGYGLTETSPFASYNHRLKFVPGSIGTPIDCVEMKIVDTDTGADCPPGELGEIAIRGPNVMLGYWNRPEDTADAIRDGWFRSGDIGRRDDRGFFFIVDRVKDMITVGGLKVYPAEVERVLLDHPSVSQVAVVGTADEVFGEQVVAFVVRSETNRSSGDPIPAILQHANEHLANYKVPRTLSLIDELPRNPSGKVLKTKLRELEVQSAADDSTSTSRKLRLCPPTLRSNLEKTYAINRNEVAHSFVQSLVQTITGSNEPLDPQTRFLDTGLDSLMIVEMGSQIQVEFGTQQEIPATLVFDHPRICDLTEFLVLKLAPTTSSIETTTDSRSNPDPTASTNLHHEISRLTEQQALEELMKELEA
jgi:long-chain acyl-CoA synthetase